MKIRYGESSDALYIKFKDSRYFESDEVARNVILDYDENSNVIGIEILDVSTYIEPDELSTVNFEVSKVLDRVNK